MSENKFRWYIVHAVSGFEKRVATTIQEQAAKKNLAHMFDKVIVPVEKVMEVRRGQKIEAERKFLPGYVLVSMDMNDDSWHLIKNVPKVTGFLGAGGKPQPIPEKEALHIINQMQEGITKDKSGIEFEIGESVKVIDGPFDSFVGVVEDLDLEKHRLKVSVSIFGRSTPVELEYSQVMKVS